ncbi:MAG TPA: glycosyltransferase [Candidatus Saccharimonadales bacterium]|nr:glycosyltransferase [Candidatus Saccharimonadales bacterium]
MKSSVKPISSQTITGLKSSGPLRRMLLIGDFQWELKELAPELSKICEMEIFDLHPDLHRHKPAGQPPAEIVARAIAGFIGSQHGLEPDVILFYARPALLSDEVFHLLRKKWSCPLLGMNLDDKIEFLQYNLFSSGNDNYQRWARQFDLNLSNVRAVVDWYGDRKLPVVYMPEGYHPKVAGPAQDVAGFHREISFVGSRKPEREIFFRELLKLGVPIQPVGYGWPDSESGKDPEAVYRSSMLNLGIGFASPSETLTTLKTRDFECPGAGACYLTTFNWELAMHFDIGREILCYRSQSELVEQFSFYRRRPEECLKIAQAAWRRCVAEHTWEQRFRKIFQQTGFKC